MPAHVTEERSERRAGAEACPYEWLICSSAHDTEERNDRRAGTEAFPYEWLICMPAHDTEERNDRRAGTEACPYEWLSNSVSQVLCKSPSIRPHILGRQSSI
jgi:hypothetical protein